MDAFQESLEKLIYMVLIDHGGTREELRWWRALEVFVEAPFRRPTSRDLVELAVSRAKSMLSTLRKGGAKNAAAVAEVNQLLDALYSLPTEPRERYVLR